MAKSELPPSEALYPVPIVLVSCTNSDNKKSNIITIAWCGVVCSNPPLLTISIRPSRYSHDLIKRAGNFVINIPTVELADKADLCGVVSGKDNDKFKLCSFTEAPSSKISSSMIKECPVNIECILKNAVPLGSHDMFIGEVVLVHADAEILTKDKRIDYKKTKPFVYNQGEYWDLGTQIGHYGCSRR